MLNTLHFIVNVLLIISLMLPIIMKDNQFIQKNWRKISLTIGAI